MAPGRPAVRRKRAASETFACTAKDLLLEKATLRRYFRHGSVTRAAEELSLAQPTVSCLIKKLSVTMGGPLTHSRERRIEATALGNEVLGLCHDVIAALERFDQRRPMATPRTLPAAETTLAEV
jgi:DNA-binding transcriptional LysR family regulator